MGRIVNLGIGKGLEPLQVKNQALQVFNWGVDFPVDGRAAVYDAVGIREQDFLDIDIIGFTDQDGLIDGELGFSIEPVVNGAVL